jgi:hypothetical protein
MPEFAAARSLLAAILLGLVAVVISYAMAIQNERKALLTFGRALLIGTALLVLVLILTLWSMTGHFPLTTMGEFLVTLTFIQIAFALLLDLWKRRRMLTPGSALAGLMNIALAMIVLAPEPRTEGMPPILHIVTFLVSFAAFQTLFISSFTTLLIQRILKRKSGLWMFEMTPSLEASTRTGMISLIVGLIAFTVGLLSAYLVARQSNLPEGWRIDMIVYITSATWLAYVVTFVCGVRTRFRGRLFHIASMASFVPLILTILTTFLWSGFHRFPR